jgi:hypothetical protein
MDQQQHVCPDCGSEFRMAYLWGDPPEPYGEVCDCPEVYGEFREAGAEKRAMDARRTTQGEKTNDPTD